jgi:Tfp pilus assembly protein PilP
VPVPVNFSYQRDGRRDPFSSLVGAGPGSDSGMALRRGEGVAGIAVAELTVRGVMQSRIGLTAMIQGPDKKTYVVHVGDKLADGVIKAVTLQGLVIVQEVNDPLSLVKQREVTRRLRSLEDAKQ